MKFPVKDSLTEDELKSGLKNVIMDGLTTQAIATLTGVPYGFCAKTWGFEPDYSQAIATLTGVPYGFCAKTWGFEPDYWYSCSHPASWTADPDTCYIHCGEIQGQKRYLYRKHGSEQVILAADSPDSSPGFY